MPPVKVKTTITRNYGAYSAAFGLEVEIEATKRVEVIDEYTRLHETIRIAILDFEQNMLRKLPAAPGNRAAPTMPSIDQDTKGAPKGQWVKAFKMYSESKKGKQFFYIQTWSGTKWSKHGVPVYLDNFEGLGETALAHLMDGKEINFEPDMYVAIVTVNDRDKGVRLAHKDEIDV